jgi:predicted SAM-dependent methyltransferase
MRLNLGCGNTKFPGWVNADKVAACNPDQVVDLERFPWPWPDDSADEVMLSHVLEHLGATPDVYLGIVKELYRVCRDGASITIIVPHPRHDHFLTDPTHVRAITPEGLRMFSQAVNREWMAKQAANTPLGIYLGVDFEIESIDMTPGQPWRGKFERGEITEADLDHAARTYNNVVAEIRMLMRPIKPAGRKR